jgi:hypothetical protein
MDQVTGIERIHELEERLFAAYLAGYMHSSEGNNGEWSAYGETAEEIAPGLRASFSEWLTTLA